MGILRRTTNGETTMKTTTEELKEQIKKVVTSTFISFVADTEVKMNKTGNPYLGARKVSHVSGQLGKDYEVAVNNQLAREDKDMDFVAQPPKGKLHTDNRHFLTDEKTRTKTYLVIYPSKKSEETKAKLPNRFYFRGVEISEELLKPFYGAISTPKSQGTDKPIIYRTYELKNIKQMRLLGEDYEVENMPEAKKDAVEEKEVVKA